MADPFVCPCMPPAPAPPPPLGSPPGKDADNISSIYVS